MPWIGLQFVIVVFPDHTHLHFVFLILSECVHEVFDTIFRLFSSFKRALFKTYYWAFHILNVKYQGASFPLDLIIFVIIGFVVLCLN